MLHLPLAIESAFSAILRAREAGHGPQYRYLLALCFVLSLSSLAEAGLLNPPVNTSPVTPATANNGEFLPVRDAYPLSVEVLSDRLLLHFQITPGYFLYGDRFAASTSDAAHHTTNLMLVKEKGDVVYDEFFQKDVEKFHRDITVTALLPANADPDGLDTDITFQGCAEAGLCYPPETVHFRIDSRTHTAVEIAGNTSDDSSTGNSAADNSTTKMLTAQTTSAEQPSSLAVMFAFAFIGGLILNLMPCVFPVLSIKLLSLARSNLSGAHVREHSWCYTLGVVSTFVATALVLIALRTSGEALGWGFQLQSPWFVGALAFLFFMLALDMSGFIGLGSRFAGVGQPLTEGSHYRHSFFTGVLAVIVASPCSVPFMGVALGYALTQPLWAALVIFSGIGIGLAAPFLVFAYVPWLIRHLPKPGAWMETLKHWLALPLYLTSLWLLWVLWHQIGDIAPHTNAQAGVEKYSAATLAADLAQHEPVFVELTADWCITCLVNEKTALTRPDVTASMKQHHIHYLRGDWTNRDTEITALLKEHQRAGVPLYLYYDANGKLSILPQILSGQVMLDAFNN